MKYMCGCASPRFRPSASPRSTRSRMLTPSNAAAILPASSFQIDAGASLERLDCRVLSSGASSGVGAEPAVVVERGGRVRRVAKGGGGGVVVAVQRRDARGAGGGRIARGAAHLAAAVDADEPGARAVGAQVALLGIERFAVFEVGFHVNALL